MKWLKDNSGGLTVLATVVLVLVTVVYVRLTAKLSKSAAEQLVESQRSRLDIRMPSVTGKAGVERTSPREVHITLELINWGTQPADLGIDAPEAWPPSNLANENEPSSTDLTLPPGQSITVWYNAPIDPSVEIAPTPPLHHLQHLGLEVRVSPLTGGVFDLFTWGVTYDPASDAIEPYSPYLLHEWRKYTGLS